MNESMVQRVAVLVFPFLLAGCVSAPTYVLPDSVTDRAFLKVDHKDRSIISGALRVDRRTEPPACSNLFMNPAFQGSEKVIMKSFGNPLITDINPDGAWIPAGERLMFSAIWMADSSHCTVTAAFTPEKNSHYVLGLETFSKDGRSYCLPRILTAGQGGTEAPTRVELESVKCVEPPAAAR